MAEKKEWNYKTITVQDMYDYISENAPDDKAWFKGVAFDDKGSYQHLIAKKAFAEKYMPDIIPIKIIEKKSDMFKDW